MARGLQQLFFFLWLFTWVSAIEVDGNKPFDDPEGWELAQWCLENNQRDSNPECAGAYKMMEEMAFAVVHRTMVHRWSSMVHRSNAALLQESPLHELKTSDSTPLDNSQEPTGLHWLDKLDEQDCAPELGDSFYTDEKLMEILGQTKSSGIDDAMKGEADAGLRILRGFGALWSKDEAPNVTDEAIEGIAQALKDLRRHSDYISKSLRKFRCVIQSTYASLNARLAYIVEEQTRHLEAIKKEELFEEL
ncbi:hypothetical protein BU16DRAFT_613053 [Lophium mytilinum]|uniref:Uncharacterized protein n=1 Tax=Lophium mytilinum TaxID=390894 RepID=A0A6A6R9C2_9PEZI|nr:hypothetical protein BU16DRAFT_613053 [Lophium mytilinum]